MKSLLLLVLLIPLVCWAGKVLCLTDYLKRANAKMVEARADSPPIEIQGHPLLVVGGGRAKHFPVHPPDVVTLNIMKVALPDHLGDIQKTAFKDNQFSEILFENLPGQIFERQNLDPLRESHRILRAGGKLRFELHNSYDLRFYLESMAQMGFIEIKTSPGGQNFTAIEAIKGP